MNSRESADDPEGEPDRVLVLLEQARTVGLVRQLLEALDRVRCLGIQPHVACILREGTDFRPLERAFRTRKLEHTLLRESGPFDLAPLFGIRRLVARIRPGVLESHGYKTALFALLVGRLTDTPWVAFYHGRTSTDRRVRVYHALERWAMSHADAICTVAEGVELHFRAADRGRVVVIPNGVIDLEAASSDRWEVRRRLGFSGEARVVGFVGRLSHEKGPDLFLETVARLRNRIPHLRALAVGDGPDRQEVESRISRLGLTGTVVLAGHVDSMAEMYSAMDLLLISSRSEVFPNVLLEAVDAGLPVAAMPVGGLVTVGHGLPTVVLSDAPSAEGLARAAEEALGRAGKDRLAQSRLTLRDRYSQERRSRLLVSVYRGIVSGEAA